MLSFLNEMGMIQRLGLVALILLLVVLLVAKRKQAAAGGAPTSSKTKAEKPAKAEKPRREKKAKKPKEPKADRRSKRRRGRGDDVAPEPVAEPVAEPVLAAPVAQVAHVAPAAAAPVAPAQPDWPTAGEGWTEPYAEPVTQYEAAPAVDHAPQQGEWAHQEAMEPVAEAQWAQEIVEPAPEPYAEPVTQYEAAPAVDHAPQQGEWAHQEAMEPVAQSEWAQPEAVEPVAEAQWVQQEIVEPVAQSEWAQPEQTEWAQPEVVEPVAEAQWAQPEAVEPVAEAQWAQPEVAEAQWAQPEAVEPVAQSEWAQPEAVEPVAEAQWAQQEIVEPVAEVPSVQPEIVEPVAEAQWAQPEAVEPVAQPDQAEWAQVESVAVNGEVVEQIEETPAHDEIVAEEIAASAWEPVDEVDLVESEAFAPVVTPEPAASEPVEALVVEEQWQATEELVESHTNGHAHAVVDDAIVVGHGTPVNGQGRRGTLDTLHHMSDGSPEPHEPAPYPADEEIPPVESVVDVAVPSPPMAESPTAPVEFWESLPVVAVPTQETAAVVNDAVDVVSAPEPVVARDELSVHDFVSTPPAPVTESTPSPRHRWADMTPTPATAPEPSSPSRRWAELRPMSEAQSASPVQPSPEFAPVAPPAPVVPAVDSARRGRFALGGYAMKEGQEIISGVTYRSEVIPPPTRWLLGPATGPVPPGTLILNVEGYVNCSEADIEVVMQPGFAPTSDGFSIRLTASEIGSFAASGTYEIH